MPPYVALIHKDADSCYGVSFPDVPGVITAGDSLEEAIEEAAEALAFAAEDWINADGSSGLKPPRSIAQLRQDPDFIEAAKDAIVVTVDYPADAAD